MNVIRRSRHHWPVMGPALLSAVLSSWALGTVGWGNLYYSAAVRSMSQSWRAFIFGSLDTAGFVTVDKPPLSLWVQAVSVRLFGFHPMSLLVPQVLAGVGAVVLLYAAVVRYWGRTAAVIAATALAVAPISVMVNHSNNTDAILVLTMTATFCAGVRAVASGSWRWWIATALLFGASFTTKMLAAAPVLPAVLVAFTVGVVLPLRRRLVMAVVGGIIAVVSALAWFAYVDLTPASERPYVGSSADNSAFQLAFERNGINQVEGGQGITGGGGPTGPLPGGPSTGGPPVMPQPGDLPPPGAGPPGMTPPGMPPPGMTPPGMPQPGMGQPGMGRGFAGGDPGLLRLFNADLGTQIGWLIVPALIGAAAAAGTRRRLVLRDPVVVGSAVWFLAGASIYCVTKGIVHPYYVASIVPPAAALIGTGVGAVLTNAREQRTTSLLGLAVFLSGVTSWLIARQIDWTPAIVASFLVTIAGVALVAWSRSGHRRALTDRWLTFVAAAVLVVPLVWTMGSLAAGLSAHMPYADPTVGSSTQRPGPPGGTPREEVDDALIAYLTDNRGDATWLVATPSAMTAAPIIIKTGEAVMAFGGFSGADRILSTKEFDDVVAGGELRFVMLDDRIGGAGGGSATGDVGAPGGRPRGDMNGDLVDHVLATCVQVAEVESLYDCSPTAVAAADAAPQVVPDRVMRHRSGTG